MMFGSKGGKIEHEIVVVGRQLAFVNHKLLSQLETIKDLTHEYKGSLGVEGMLNCLSFPSPSRVPRD